MLPEPVTSETASSDQSTDVYRSRFFVRSVGQSTSQSVGCGTDEALTVLEDTEPCPLVGCSSSLRTASHSVLTEGSQKSLNEDSACPTSSRAILSPRSRRRSRMAPAPERRADGRGPSPDVSRSISAPSTQTARRTSKALSVAAGAIASGRQLPSVGDVSPAVFSKTPVVRPTTGNVDDSAAPLAQLQRLNKEQAVKIASQSMEILSIKSELRALKESVTSPSADHASDCTVHDGRARPSEDRVRAVCGECERHKKQIHDMTKFLADYGLTWVGDSSDLPASGLPCTSEGLGEPAGEAFVASIPDLNVMRSRVSELNLIAARESTRIVSEQRDGCVRARLVVDAAPSLPLTFFLDGLTLGGRALALYESEEAKRIIEDVLDGFFPLCLKREHPEGVRLEVVDRTDISYEGWKTRTRSDSVLVNGAPSTSRRTRLRVRREVSAARREVSLLGCDRDPKASFARVQVKFEDHSIVVLLEPEHTVGTLQECLALEDGPSTHSNYILRTACPPLTYADPEQTMADAGFVPSATIYASAGL